MSEDFHLRSTHVLSEYPTSESKLQAMYNQKTRISSVNKPHSANNVSDIVQEQYHRQNELPGNRHQYYLLSNNHLHKLLVPATGYHIAICKYSAISCHAFQHPGRRYPNQSLSSLL